jgi:hypothetical protein
LRIADARTEPKGIHMTGQQLNRQNCWKHNTVLRRTVDERWNTYNKWKIVIRDCYGMRLFERAI